MAFFFSSRRRHTRCGRDWSSDVCSSDLVPAGRFLDQVLAPLAADLEERGVAVDVDLAVAAGARVAVDRDRFPRVLENLLRNAREAVLAGAGERRVAVRARSMGGGLEGRVAGTGAGIPVEAAAHLFEPVATPKRQ